jgi:hypothetical protein
MTTTSTTPAVSTVAQIEALFDRLTRVRTLVASHKVYPIYGRADHYIVEGSNARYLVNGSCNCPDATNRVELTKGLYKHRLAAMVYAEQQAKAEATPTSEAESPESNEELARKVADLYR